MKTIMRSPGGTARREVAVKDIQIPDLWHIAKSVDDEGRKSAAEAVLECWHLCHDLLAAVSEAES